MRRWFPIVAALALLQQVDAVWAQDCLQHLDRLQQALEQGELDDEQQETLQRKLELARQHANDGDEEGCSAAAAQLESSMLQADGIDPSMLCDRAQSEGEIGEADMAGNQDVQSALQSGCAALK